MRDIVEDIKRGDRDTPEAICGLSQRKQGATMGEYGKGMGPDKDAEG